MKKSVAMKWIKALRSGKYYQAIMALESRSAFYPEASYCCLGVLCRLAPKSVKLELDAGGALVGGDLEQQHAVRKWAGLKTSSGILSDGETLTSLNDTGSSFKEIADIIEKNWEKL